MYRTGATPALNASSRNILSASLNGGGSGRYLRDPRSLDLRRETAGDSGRHHTLSPSSASRSFSRDMRSSNKATCKLAVLPIRPPPPRPRKGGGRDVTEKGGVVPRNHGTSDNLREEDSSPKPASKRTRRPLP